MNTGNVGGVTTDIVAEDIYIGSYILDYASEPVPVLALNTFIGWGYDALGAVMVGAKDTVTKDATIYAIYTLDA